jgi:hypothetical protein
MTAVFGTKIENHIVSTYVVHLEFARFYIINLFNIRYRIV